MAVRWRKDGTLICAEASDPEEGDTYIDDRLTGMLAGSREESLHVLVCTGKNPDGADLWKFVKTTK